MNQVKQRGVTMMEVLVTILVGAVGLAGVMGMEALAIKTNHQAYLRTQAILQAQDLADRMHANLKGVDDGDYATAIPTSQPSPNCLSANCTPEQLAAFDKWEWQQANERLLPAGAGTITYSSIEEAHTITVAWKEEGNAGTADKNFSFVYKPLPIYLL